MITPTILIVAKAPVPGLAKTRLSPPFSQYEAASLAAAALLDTLDAVRATPGVHRVVALTGDLNRAIAANDLHRALENFMIIKQRGDTFADRLIHAHIDATEGSIFQVGMDTPQLTPAMITHATTQLLADPGPDAVLGPAADGGWWGLGLRRARDVAALAGVPMSTPTTGADTEAALRKDGLRVVRLPELSDVDMVADVAAVAAAAPETRFARLASVLTVSA